MRMTTQRSTRGKHRKITTSQTTKGRIALVTVATGAVSTAGIGGAAAAQIQANDTEAETTVTATPEYELAANTSDIAAQVAEAAPQILAIAEHKPADYIQQQLTTAVQFADVRAQLDQALRAPSVVKPAEGVFTSGYGPRWGTLHAGIDIANAVGTPILAVMDGVVVDSGPASGYGNWIRIQHEDGTISLYGHMETLDVAVGQTVTAGQKIADMGNRGFSTGSHLHFEIHPGGHGAVVSPAQGTFTSGYGMRWGTLHAGIDIANAIGTPILAIMDGTVIDSGPASGYGQWIRIQHSDGSVSVYGHMSTLAVSVGQSVTAGQQIAGMGSEGFSTGSHLHFEIHPSGNGAVDPVPWFAERGVFIQ